MGYAKEALLGSSAGAARHPSTDLWIRLGLSIGKPDATEV